MYFPQDDSEKYISPSKTFENEKCPDPTRTQSFTVVLQFNWLELRSNAKPHSS